MRAILREMQEDSGTLGTGPIGQEGILEIFESERSHPGRVSAKFSYPAPLNGVVPESFEGMPGQIWTSFSYVLEEKGSTVRLVRGGRSGQNRFVFERLDK
jgi:hypothetical protein